ncbi:MAG TPA: radical SAM protein, partial [Allocoleopsis sp.]
LTPPFLRGDGGDQTPFLNGDYPLIFAGGQTATSNPEPYADFLDFVALGDGEELLPEIGLIVEEGKKLGLSRQELLLDLAQIPGVYVPQFYDMQPDGSVIPNRPDVPKRILRRVATPIPFYSVGLVPYIETVHDRLSIEIRRGCTRGCRFCQPGMLTRPARDVAPEDVIKTVEQAIKETGYNEFSLLSLSCSDYLALPSVGMEIKNKLKNQNVTLSLPSQRVDRFDENIANILGGNRQGGLTFAPEAGTQRMRDIVNKGLTNEELLRGVKTAYEQGWDKIKLYFMIGLPGETDDDIIGIAETIRWLQQECKIKGRKLLAFNVTISNFTPKPHTPFQWHS